MVAAARARHHRYTSEEYLEMERAAAARSEFLDGEIVAMAGSTPEHSAITANLTIEVGSQLRGGPCQPYTSDLRVCTDPDRHYCYPDLSVVCGEVQFVDGTEDTIVNPTVIFEVLSPSTERYDRGSKWLRYQQIESLSDYVLVSQNEPRVEHFARQPGNRWLLANSSGLDAEFRIDSINCLVRLRNLYDRITFAPAIEPDQESEAE